jgi:hypothetical protein
MRRLLDRPWVWYGPLSCLLVTAFSLVLQVGQQTPPISAPSGLFISVPQLEWQPMVVLLGTAAAVAWHTGRIRVAAGTALCAYVGSWLLMWALLIVPTALGIPPLLSVPLVQQTRSISLQHALFLLGAVSVSLTQLGVVVAFVGALLGWRVQHLLRQRLSSVEG